MRTAFALTFALLASRALAGVPEVIDTHILPGTAGFAAATAELEDAAVADCRAAALRPAYQAAFDAWMRIAHLRLGPVEDDGRELAIAFWPDTRGMVRSTVDSFLAAEDPVVRSPEEFSQVSVAARGFFALERLLYEEDLAGYGSDDYACAYATAIATDLARLAGEIDAGWQGEFGAILRSPGAPGNARFLSEREAQQAIYDTLAVGLEFTSDQRLGRPLGTFDRPRPTRAEAWRSERPLRNVRLSLDALHDLARTIAEGGIPSTEAAFAAASDAAGAIDDPTFANVENPQGWLEIEILQQRVDAVRQAIIPEIGDPLGLRTEMFNRSEGGD